MRHFVQFTTFIAVIVAAAAGVRADLGALDPAARPNTRFAAHYVLALDVSLRGLMEDELCKAFPLDKDGKLQLTIGDRPIEPIPISGLTASEARDRIKQSIARFYAVEPDVRVGIAKIPRIKVTVMGATFRQGSVTIADGSRLQDALTESGFQPNADLARIEIARMERDGTRTLLRPDFGQAAQGNADERNNPLLQNGDTISIPLSVAPVPIRRIHVAGAVHKDGPYVLKSGMTIRDALAAADGLLPTADPDSITLLRLRSGARSMVTYARVQQNAPTDNLKLEEDDVVIVGRKDTGLRYSVTGAVVHQQTFDYKGAPTLKQAITDCGGFRPEADRGKVVLMRNMLQDPTQSKAVVVDFDRVAKGEAPDIPLQAGDVVQVQAKRHTPSPLLEIGLFVLRRFLPF